MSEDSPQEHQVTRRQFGKAAILTAIGLSPIAALVAYNHANENNQNNEVEKKRQELEQKYGIELITLKELYAEAEKAGQDVTYPYKIDTKNAPPEQWDSQRLQLVDEVLGILPPHFYDQYQNKKLRIVLGDKSTLLSEYAGEPNPILDRPNMVSLDYRHLSPEFPLLGYRVITHELDHLVTCWKESNARCVDTNTSNSRFFANVDTIVGGFQNELTRMPNLINAKILELSTDSLEYDWIQFEAKIKDGLSNGTLTPQNASSLYFYRILSTGFLEPDQRHLLTALAEIYIQGKDFFQKLETFYSPETTQQLYEFIKQDMFEGREYELVNGKPKLKQ